MLTMILSASVAVAPALAPPQEPLRYDRKGRPAIAVRVNDSGPFFMVVDTAAETSLVSEALMTRLVIAPLGSEVTVNGATGRTTGRIYGIDRFATALFNLDHVGLPALPNGAVTEASGIVGMDLFRTRRLVIDRTGARVQAEPSGPPASGFTALRGRLAQGTFLIVPVTINGVTVQALVDSGADTTIANTAALKALNRATDDLRLVDGGEIRGGAGGTTRIRTANVAALRIGPATLRNVAVSFAGDEVVAGPGLPPGIPAMILGSDLLNALLGYAIDFPRGELHVRMPPAHPVQ